MALHPDFPNDPHAILDPALRWFPADEALRASSFEKLLPPLVPTLRKEVTAWRERRYGGASETSQALLRWWFVEQHLLLKADGTLEAFRYFFAQREALETIIYLHDVVGVKDKYDLMRSDSSGVVRDQLFGQTVELEDANTLRNLSEPAAAKAIIEGFKKAINALTVEDKGDAEYATA